MNSVVDAKRFYLFLYSITLSTLMLELLEKNKDEIVELQRGDIEL